MKINVTNEGFKYGIILGLVGLVIMFGSWSLGMDTFIKVISWTTFIPYIIITLIIAGIQLRKKNDNVLPFKDAIKFTYLTFVIVAVITGIGTYILYNVIDKDLTQKSFEIGLEKTRSMLEKVGMPEEKIEEAMDKARTDNQQSGFKTIFLGVGLGLIWDFLKALGISILIRKEKPMDFDLNTTT